MALRILLAALILCNTGAFAQTPTFAAPADGYVFDSYSQSIRPVAGFVGSAVLGTAVAGGIDWASIAPNKTSAIVRRNRTLFWVPNLSSPDQAQELNEPQTARSVQVLWASDSSRAVVLADGEQLVWLNNLSTSPSVEARWTLSFPRGRETRADSVVLVSLLAADSSANNVLLGAHAADGWQLQLASTTLPPAALPFSGVPAAAAFLSSGSAALVADTAAHQIVELQNLNGSNEPTMSAVVTSETYVAQPAGIVLSTDNKQLFIVDPGMSMIRVFDAAAGTLLNEIPVSAGLSSVTPFDAGRFILTQSAKAVQPILILNTATPPQIAFIPRSE